MLSIAEPSIPAFLLFSWIFLMDIHYSSVMTDACDALVPINCEFTVSIVRIPPANFIPVICRPGDNRKPEVSTNIEMVEFHNLRSPDMGTSDVCAANSVVDTEPKASIPSYWMGEHGEVCRRIVSFFSRKEYAIF
jgi:hypothetical protein